jgi:putative glutamine amidotransferase
MKIVMVSQRILVADGRGETWDCLDQALSTFLTKVGLISIALPNALPRPDQTTWMNTVEPSGLILSGGGDVYEDPDRNRTEDQALDYARDRRIPVLGICRGMQKLGVLGGASLIKVTDHVNTRHELIGDSKGEVNSFHAFSLADCPTNYTVECQATDGVIESIRHTDLPWLGLMWHPEREAPYRQSDINLLQELFDTSVGSIR